MSCKLDFHDWIENVTQSNAISKASYYILVVSVLSLERLDEIVFDG